MGCSCDIINITVESEEIAQHALDIFNEVLKDRLYDDETIKMDDLVCTNESIPKLDYKWTTFCIEGEPLFLSYEEDACINDFIRAFIEKMPENRIDVEQETTFTNCGEINVYKYIYSPDKKELLIKKMYAEQYSLDYCEECDETFDALTNIYDYNESEEYVCPVCGATLHYNIYSEEEIVKL